MTPQASEPKNFRTTRLAPSPTGALHLGNVRTFLVTWAIARLRGWQILMRIEDLDTPRIKPGAAEELLETLEWLGLDWDRWSGLWAGEPDRLIQSEDLTPYRAAMRELARAGMAYPCSLTRGQIDAAASAPQEGSHETPFPPSLRPEGTGAPLDFDAVDSADGDARPNWRILTTAGVVEFRDEFAGPQRFDVASIVGDFVVWTKRGLPSYQLAVVVDDHRQGVTDVIRGDDLLDSAARQLLLYRALGQRPEPRYLHLPLVRGEDGRRLAKRHGDTRIGHYRSRGVGREAIIGLMARWCGLTPPDDRRRMDVSEFRQRLDVNTIPHHPITFTSEDDAWLLAQAR